MKLRMLNGDDAMLSPTEGIEGANITSVDAQTSNGIIHVVDKVLMPPVDSETDGDSTAAGTSDEDGNLLLIVGIVLIVAIIGGLLVVRFARRGHDGLEAIQAIGKTDVGLPQTTPAVQSSATTRQKPPIRPISNKRTSSKPTSNSRISNRPTNPLLSKPPFKLWTTAPSPLSSNRRSANS